MGLTLIEKIAGRHADGLAPGTVVRSGDFISIRPRHVMTHDNTGAVIPKFKQIGATTIADPAQPVFAIDHDIQNTSPENLAKYSKIEAFAREHGIDFYPPGTGISHQVMVEQGYVAPGAMVVASDSHSNLYGAVAALGTPVVRTDAASIWATGVTWWQVPPVAKVVLKGKLSPGVVGKDVIIALCGLFNKDEVLNYAVEFVGDGVTNLPMSARMTIANMTTEWGALAGVFPFDEVTLNYLRSRVPEFSNPKRPGTRSAKSRAGYTNADIDEWWQNRNEFSADPDAGYAIELELDLATVVPHVSGPNEVKTMVSLPKGLLVVVRERALRRFARRGRSGARPGRTRGQRGGILSRARERRSAGQIGIERRLANSAERWRNSVTARLRRMHRTGPWSGAKRRDRDQCDQSQFQRAHGRPRRFCLSRVARCRRCQRVGRIYLRAHKFQRSPSRHRNPAP